MIKGVGQKGCFRDGLMTGALWLLLGFGLLLFRWLVQKKIDRYRVEDSPFEEDYDQKELD